MRTPTSQPWLGKGSLGRPRTRSPTMLRCTCAVPPQMVDDRLDRKFCCHLSGSYSVGSDSGPMTIESAPRMSSSNDAKRCEYSDQNILLIDAPGPGSFLATTSLSVLSPLKRMISTWVKAHASV